MNCKTHKTYRGIRKPTANCRKCKFIFAWRKVLKACGFPVAQVRRAPKAAPCCYEHPCAEAEAQHRAPKSEATKVGEFCKEFGVAVLAPTKTENFSAGLVNEIAGEMRESLAAGQEGALPGQMRVLCDHDTLAKLSREYDELHFPAPTKDQQDALALQVASIKLGAEKRVETFGQVRNIGEGAKAE